MFFGDQIRSRARRRGVVLILILGMLALMALIGVTFATFAGQSLAGSRNFKESVSFPSSEQVMDFALAQLINDTSNPNSGLRGHSLLRDMFGNDSLMTGNAASFRAYLNQLPNGQAIQISLLGFNAGGANLPYNYTGLLQYSTNIPIVSIYPALYNLDFTHWVLKIPGGNGNVAQTLEVVRDDAINGAHTLTVAPLDPNDQSDLTNTGYPVTKIYGSPDTPYVYGDADPGHTGARKGYLTMNQPPIPLLGASAISNNYPQVASGVTLDSRYMRAFNGPGMSQSNNVAAGLGLNATAFNGADQPHNSAAFANFRINGTLLAYPFNPGLTMAQLAVPSFGDPGAIGMDEDYDACDLENWYLALQSADGQVMIPSFHRPGILTRTDWQHVADGTAAGNLAAIMSTAKILRPRQVDNSPLFPADPVADAGTGKIKFDVDNDGDGVTDSVWLDLGYPVQRDPRGQTFKPLFAFMVIGLNGRLPLNTAGNLQGRDFQIGTSNSPQVGPFSPNNANYGPAIYKDGPTWSHASHLGYSVNEINPSFALQNAPNLVYGTSFLPGIPSYMQFDNAGVDVSLTQLRNVLAGTIPQDTTTASSGASNHDYNFVVVNNAPFYMPNGVMDSFDGTVMLNGVPTVVRSGVAPVAGRWGEPQGIPTSLSIAPVTKSFTDGGGTTNTWISPVYTNPVRAGRSVQYSTSSGWITSDAMDDDLDAFDFFPNDAVLRSSYNLGPFAPISSGEGVYLPANSPPALLGDYYEADMSIQLPVERIRRFVTPIDPVGVGRVVAWDERPQNVWDYGTGYDKYGRTAFFRYYRPAGVPKAIAYDTRPGASEALTPFQTNEVYNQPIARGANLPERTNNRLHGMQSMMLPISGIAATGATAPLKAEGIAVAGSMPFDMSGNVPFYTLPYALFPASTSTMSTQVNSGQGPLMPPAVQTADTTGTGARFDYPDGAASVVNAYPSYPSGTTPQNTAPSSSLNKDEADEMNLYASSLIDQPFGPSDLEWLYRRQDVDGASLDSRLARLAPVSFTNPADSSTRRRLFSTDSWEMITYAHSPDNPQGAFPWNSRLDQTANGALWPITANANPAGTPPNYLPQSTTAAGRLTLPVDGSGYPVAAANFPSVLTYPPGFMPNYPAQYPVHPTAAILPGNQFLPITSPSVAHRDRKINLNYPLPVSNDPAEPVRQKWIRETYQLFKAILPPQATDTPAELAALSQYVVNIIDFRDPDCSSTRFVNTDLMVVQPTTGSSDPSKVVFANLAPPGRLGSGKTYHAYDPKIFDEQKFWPATVAGGRSSEWVTATTGASGDFLVQHGMEYSPLALNEVLAYSYSYKGSSSAVRFTRFAIELVNMLTDDAGGQNTSHLGDTELDGWELVITPDNQATSPSATTPPATNTGKVVGRPDPTTGDILPDALDAAKNVDPATRPQVVVIRDTGSGTPDWANHTFQLKDPHSVPTPYGPSKIAPMIDSGPRTSKSFFVLGSQEPPKYSTGSPIGVNESPAIQNDGELPANFAPPNVGGTTGTRWYWLYLRRPANPFDRSDYDKREMVVVDSIRFPYSDSGASGMTSMGTDSVTGTPLTAYSSRRLQPYRGGQLVPPIGAGAAPVPAYAWGYSDQMNPYSPAATAKYGTSAANVATLAHSIGQIPSALPAEYDPQWDNFPFHDRDFQSVAELLLVPSCPPGLFTKQFVEENFNPNTPTPGPTGSRSATPSPYPKFLDTSPAVGATPTGNETGRVFQAGPPETPRTYPYLPDEFFYTAASVAPFTNPPTAAAPYPVKVGTWTGDGWHRMLEFVEVPSSANGAIAPVGAGANFDWARQDLKPGLLNLNLIIDEEVFFGLIDDPRLNIQPPFTNSALPRIVTEINANGYPSWYVDTTKTPNFNYSGAYPISNVSTAGSFVGRGFTYFDPIAGEVHGLKPAFSDFLKLRAGGSGFLFAWGSGVTGTGDYYPYPAGPSTTPLPPTMLYPVAAERPFRSLSYPDINATVMRPAMLPPTAPIPASGGLPIFPGTNPNANFVPPYVYTDNFASPGVAPVGAFVGDPAIRNPFVNPDPLNYVAGVARGLPVIALRRLFQIPDTANATVPPSGAADYTYTGGSFGTPGVQTGGVSTYQVNTPIEMIQLSNFSTSTNGHSANLFSPSQTILIPGGGGTTQSVNHHLGAGLTGGTDRRQHPLYRTEMLQKVMNLTTVRTHQFAVWITVAFFEVLKPGTPSMGIPDVLGAELGQLSGRNVRYRSFFLLDRTKAVGFNPSSPIDFRDVVTYRRRIE